MRKVYVIMSTYDPMIVVSSRAQAEAIKKSLVLGGIAADYHSISIKEVPALLTTSRRKR